MSVQARQWTVWLAWGQPCYTLPGSWIFNGWGGVLSRLDEQTNRSLDVGIVAHSHPRFVYCADFGGCVML